MGNTGAKLNGKDQAPLKVSDSMREPLFACDKAVSYPYTSSRLTSMNVAHMLKTIDEATKTKYSGLLVN
jgi:hypothetical protein